MQMTQISLDVVERRGNSNAPHPNIIYKTRITNKRKFGKRINSHRWNINGTPTMAYFYDGKWHRVSDDSVIKNQTIDIYLLAGQSNI